MLCKVIKDNKKMNFGQGARLLPLLQTPQLHLLPPLMPDKAEGKSAALQAKVLLLFAEVQIIYYQSKEIL